MDGCSACDPMRAIIPMGSFKDRCLKNSSCKLKCFNEWKRHLLQEGDRDENYNQNSAAFSILATISLTY